MAALELDGVDGYVTIQTYLGVNLADIRHDTTSRNDGFTISMYIKKDGCASGSGSHESIFSQAEATDLDMHDVSNPNINLRYGSCSGNTPYTRLNLVNSNQQYGRADALVRLEPGVW